MKISDYVNYVCTTRKRTGVVFADNHFKQAIGQFKEAGLVLIDAADWFDGQIMLTDDTLIGKILKASQNAPYLLVNLELFIGPRLCDDFLDQFIRKLLVKEPLNAAIILFYSKTIYTRFSHAYILKPATEHNILDLEEGYDTFN
jgi:hypothetical protein